ncbi:MAG: carboxypeptidase-like regulatory domain-containing protein, partial [Thermoanaerobaculia bacterium]
MKPREWPTCSSALLLSLFLLLCASGGAIAQEETGNLYGIVTDTVGECLPGSNVELAGMGATRKQIADSNGHFRFLGLDPGSYTLKGSLEGFSAVEQASIDIRVAQNTRIDLQLIPAIEEIISVTSESPLLDERKLSAGTTVSQVELESIPTARDPWAILNQSSGVVVWDVNVGGSSSGSQSWFRGMGTDSGQNDFVLDGVQVTAAAQG